MNTSVSAVATSWRPRRDSVPIPSALSAEKAPSPTSVETTDQARAGCARERAVRHRVGDERRAAQHHEEADRAADDRDDRRDDPGMDHEAGEHSAHRRRRWLPNGRSQHVDQQDERDDEEARGPAVVSATSRSCRRRGALRARLRRRRSRTRPRARGPANGTGAAPPLRGRSAAPSTGSRRSSAPRGPPRPPSRSDTRARSGGPAAASRSELGAGRGEQQRPVEDRQQCRDDERPGRARAADPSIESAKIEPNRIVNGRAGRRAVGPEVEEQRGQAEAGAEHDRRSRGRGRGRAGSRSSSISAGGELAS